MKFKVDELPHYSDECPFCDNDDYKYLICEIDGNECVYFKGKERNPIECRHLIKDKEEE